METTLIIVCCVCSAIIWIAAHQVIKSNGTVAEEALRLAERLCERVVELRVLNVTLETENVLLKRALGDDNVADSASRPGQTN